MARGRSRLRIRSGVPGAPIPSIIAPGRAEQTGANSPDAALRMYPRSADHGFTDRAPAPKRLPFAA